MMVSPPGGETAPGGEIPAGEVRLQGIAQNLAEVRARIAAACVTAGREPAEVSLIAVSKTYPVEDIARLVALGVRDVGENRDQEAAAKALVAAELGLDLRWHFVGHLQRNKCRSVASYASLVHSVDNVPLAAALANAAGRERNTPLDVLVQLSIDGDVERGGAAYGDVEPARDVRRVADAVAASDTLRLRGVMAVAPVDWKPADAFERLVEVAHELRVTHPEATALSAGMSEDLEEAIVHGATHVRVGSALLGKRPVLR
jgi:pyridoxal phosphate enzyme (YggS family)